MLDETENTRLIITFKSISQFENSKNCMTENIYKWVDPKHLIGTWYYFLSSWPVLRLQGGELSVYVLDGAGLNCLCTPLRPKNPSGSPVWQISDPFHCSSTARKQTIVNCKRARDRMRANWFQLVFIGYAQIWSWDNVGRSVGLWLSRTMRSMVSFSDWVFLRSTASPELYFISL